MILANSGWTFGIWSMDTMELEVLEPIESGI